MKQFAMRFCLAVLCLFTFQFTTAQPKCMQIGVGLEGPAYWAVGENAFIDQMKYRGAWLTFNAQGQSPWNTNLDQEIPMDGNGYPDAGIPYATTGGLQKCRIVVSANQRVPLGQYAFLYDGYGEFSFYGFTVDTVNPGRIVVTVTGTGNVWMHLDSSSVAPNHARNFRLVPLAEEATYAADIFRANWLDNVQPFYALRFMDWFHTNNSPIISWDMRATPASYSQADSAGIAYEYAITLCNRTGKHPWVNVPHMADSIYITRMAEMWRDSLDPSLDIYLEYSNEVWNWQFQQAQWNIQNTQWLPAHWPLNPLYDPNQNFGWNSGRHSAQVFRIWRRVWGADSLRVKRVLGTQAVWPEAVAVGNIAGCNRQYDYLSPTWYFGLSTGQSSAMGASTTAQQVVDTCRNNFYTHLLADMKSHYTIVDSTGGQGVIHYEGGQHISAYGVQNHPAQQAFYDAQYLPSMYQLYDDILDSLRDWGSELAMAFTLGGTDSRYGSWGHIRRVDSTPSYTYSPKYMALLDNILSQPAPDLGADTTLCPGASLNLDAGAGYSSYLWQDSSMAQTLLASQPGQYQVTVTDSFNCTGSGAIMVQLAPPLQLGFLWNANQLQVGFTASSMVGSLTSWNYDFGDGNTASGPSPSHTYAQAGSYQVCLTAVDSNGCAETYCDSVTVLLVGLREPISPLVKVWPVPAATVLEIDLIGWEGETGSWTLRDLQGRTLRNQSSLAERMHLEVEDLAEGIYLLEIQLGELQLVKKVLIAPK